MGVLSPLPRVDHKVTESRAGRGHHLLYPWFNRSGLNNRHQNPFRGVVAENNVGMLVLRHGEDAEFTQKKAQMSSIDQKVKSM